MKPDPMLRPTLCLLSACLLPACLLLAACASHAPDFGGPWRDANRYPQAIRAMPLQPLHAFAPSPLDGSLHVLLQRWAREAGLQLDYAVSEDYTLFAGVAGVHAVNIRDGLAQLGAAYAAQGLELAVEGDRLVARRAGTTPAASAQ